MSLKGGLGISLINRFPEELVYISLCNITMDYISTPEKVNFDISVSNIQVGYKNLCGFLWYHQTMQSSAPLKPYTVKPAVTVTFI